MSDDRFSKKNIKKTFETAIANAVEEGNYRCIIYIIKNCKKKIPSEYLVSFKSALYGHIYTSGDSNEYLEFGGFFENLGYPEIAVEFYKNGADKYNTSCMAKLGQFLEQQGKRKEAQNYFIKAVDPKNRFLFLKNQVEKKLNTNPKDRLEYGKTMWEGITYTEETYLGELEITEKDISKAKYNCRRAFEEAGDDKKTKGEAAYCVAKILLSENEPLSEVESYLKNGAKCGNGDCIKLCVDYGIEFQSSQQNQEFQSQSNNLNDTIQDVEHTTQQESESQGYSRNGSDN